MLARIATTNRLMAMLIYTFILKTLLLIVAREDPFTTLGTVDLGAFFSSKFFLSHSIPPIFHYILHSP